jgi:hypothetical protein
VCLSRSYRFLFRFIVFGIFIHGSSAVADVNNVTITTTVDQAITIVLTDSITNLPNGVTATVVLASQPANGQAQVGADGLTVIYTPNSGFTGADTFQYSAQRSDEITDGPATITVVVGGVTTQGDSPQAAVEDIFKKLCLGELTGELIDFCQPYLDATRPGAEDDLRELLDALSPKQIIAQTDLGSDMARQQVDSVVKRLVALRKGMTQAALGNLAFNVGDKSFTWDELRGASGGAASADQPAQKNLGWYINGNINYGGTEETEKEDAYTFTSGNLTTGLDYRFSRGTVVGGALGIGSTTMKIDHDNGDMDVSGATGTFYASFFPTQSLNIDIIQSFNTQEFTTTRRIIYGTIDDTAEGTTNSSLYMSSLAFGYEALNIGSFTWSLALRGDYLKSTIDGYQESGNTDYAYIFDKRTVEQINSDLNNSVTYASSYKWGVMVHQFDVSWIYHLKDDPETVRFASILAPDDFDEFTADPLDSNYFKLAYGLQSILAGGNTLYFQLQTTLAKENYYDVGLAAGLRTEF